MPCSVWLSDAAGTIPWRMSASDYTGALTVNRQRVPFRGAVPPTVWDPALGDAVRSAGVVAYEEELRASLLDAMEL